MEGERPKIRTGSVGERPAFLRKESVRDVKIDTTVLRPLSSSRAFGGVVRKFAHQSRSTNTEMKFSVYLPPHVLRGQPVPVLYFLSGLTCTEDNFFHKAGALRPAAKHGVMLVAPDTSPRGVGIEGDHAHWDFGEGAGFYVDATEEKWSRNYRMYSYITTELPQLIDQYLPTNNLRSIMGHSMGGHGALVAFLRNPGVFTSVSAFAPITNPMRVPWGIKAFTGFLGANADTWKNYDATELIKQYERKSPTPILIDQGTEDQFLREGQLTPDSFVAACKAKEYPLTMRLQDGYDHSYYFISSFIDDHIEHHAKALTDQAPQDDLSRRLSSTWAK